MNFKPAPWPTEYGDYPQLLRLHQLLLRPSLLLTLLHFLLQARRDAVLTGGFSKVTRIRPQRPSYYTSEPKAWRRWYRFVKECVPPTVFVKRAPDLLVGRFYVDGYEFDLWLYLVGREWSFAAGRRGAPAFDFEPPPAEEDFTFAGETEYEPEF